MNERSAALEASPPLEPSSLLESSLEPEPRLLRVPGWQQFPWLRAGFSTRPGGASTVYCNAESSSAAGEPQLGEQNVGFMPEDLPATVAGNRRRLVSAVAADAPMELVTMRQFHGSVVQVVHGDPQHLTPAEGKAPIEADGLMTRQPGLLLGVLTADCVPVLVADTRTRSVAGFHAGWRGTLAGIVERGLGMMQREFGSHPQDLIAAIGPAIGACCFAVGEEVRSAFESQFDYGSELFSRPDSPADPHRDRHPGPQSHLDLAQANRRQLLHAGLPAHAIHVVNECTACSRLPNGGRKYFSHRAERGRTGRMLSLIGVVPDADPEG